MGKISALLLMSVLLGCTKNTSPVPQSTPHTADEGSYTVDIGNITVGQFEALPSTINVGTATGLKKEVSAVVDIKNTAQTPQALILSVQGEGFKIKINRCPSTLQANASCKVIISFSARSLYDGEYLGSLELNNDLVNIVNLSATVEGLPNLELTGEAELEVTMTPFNSTSALPYREILIKNIGTKSATNISTVLPTDYSIRLNRCPNSLKPNKTCVIQVLYKKHRHSLPSDENISISSEDKQVTLGLLTGQETSVTLPPLFPASSKVISTASSHTCFLNSQGKAFCAGQSNMLGSGNPSQVNSPEPVAVDQGEVVFKEITTGDSWTCALSMEGEVFCWGVVGEGNLGDGRVDDIFYTLFESSPQKVTALDGKIITKIKAGSSDTCAIDSLGDAYCWGVTYRSGPTKLQFKESFTGSTFIADVDSEDGNICVVTASGAVLCQGSNALAVVSPELPATSSEADGNYSKLHPVNGSIQYAMGTQFVDIGPYKKVSLLSGVACAVTTFYVEPDQGRIVCWGYKESLNFNDDEIWLVYGSTTIAPDFISRISEMSSAAGKIIAMDTLGNAHAWGGQAEPELLSIPSTTQVLGVSMGGSNQCIINQDNVVFCKGQNYSGSLGVGAAGNFSDTEFLIPSLFTF